jgi:hypothetical protein
VGLTATRDFQRLRRGRGLACFEPFSGMFAILLYVDTDATLILFLWPNHRKQESFFASLAAIEDLISTQREKQGVGIRQSPVASVGQWHPMDCRTRTGQRQRQGNARIILQGAEPHTILNTYEGWPYLLDACKRA